MTELEGGLRSALHSKATEATDHPVAPDHVLKRVQRRRTVSRITAVVAPLCLVVVALVGVVQLTESSSRKEIDVATDRTVDAAGDRESAYEPAGTFDVGSSPGGVAVADGDLWVTLLTGEGIARLDGKTGVVSAHVRPEDYRAYFSGDAIATGAGALWVASTANADGESFSGFVGRLDTTANKVDLVQFLNGDEPAFLTVGQDAVWVTGGHTLRRLDSKTGMVVATLDRPEVLGRVVVDQQGVWVAAPENGLLLRINPTSMKVDAEIPVGRPSLGTPSVASTGNTVWISADQEVVGVDPLTNEVVHRLPTSAPVNSMTVANQELWLFTEDGLYTVRPDQTETTKRVAFKGRMLGHLAVDDDGTAWASDASGNSVRRFRPTATRPSQG